MRVLLVHTDLVGGGLPNVVTALARLLPTKQKALCYSPGPEREPTPDLLDELTACGNQLYRIDHRVLSLLYLARFRQVIREFGPDVVHLHGTTFALMRTRWWRLARTAFSRACGGWSACMRPQADSAPIRCHRHTALASEPVCRPLAGEGRQRRRVLLSAASRTEEEA